jgi:hypothetical protein
LKEEHSILGITYETNVAPTIQENSKSCSVGVDKYSEVIGELAGSLSVENYWTNLGKRTRVEDTDKFLADFESIALEGYRLCTAYALVESDYGFMGFHSRVERCRDGAKELGDVYRGYKKAMEFDKKRGVK